MKVAFFVARWLILGALAVVSGTADARKAGAPSAHVSRDVVFDGSTIGGRYLSAGEATATVEQEKKMNELIGSRANFNDRLKADSTNRTKD